MTAAATPFTAGAGDDEDLVEASRGVAMLCAPGVILHGALAGLPCVDARVLRGGVLRTSKLILVDVLALLNQTRTRLVNIEWSFGTTPTQMGVISEVCGELRRAGVRTTVEIGGQCRPDVLGSFDFVRVAIIPDLRTAELPLPATLAAAQEIRALIRSEGDLTTLASILAQSPVRVGAFSWEDLDRCQVTLDLLIADHPAEERALYELAKTAAFKNGWRLSPNAPQPRRSF